MRRWRRAVYLALGAAGLAALLAFAAMHPVERPQTLRQVRFSAPSGFYDAPFYLELEAGGGDIYYTLDSSEPDEHSIPYTGPIPIQDASPSENVYSAITDVSAYLKPELLEKNNVKEHHHYQVPDVPVDKATVVRAVCVDKRGNRGPVGDAVFFVGFGEKRGYDGMNIMSIVTDPANLFDATKGIYVLGDIFAQTVKDGHVEGDKANMFAWKANYNQRGRDWERPASVCCFGASGETVFSGQFGIRIQGKATRANLPKNLNIYARKIYGSPVINTGNLFNDEYALNRLTLYYGPSELLLADYLAETLTDGMDFADRELAPCVLFLDGEYWGVYWLAPRFKADYLSQKYGVDSRNIVEIKHGHAEVGQEEDEALYNDMVTFIADHDMRDPDNYARACELLDIQSCIDYFAMEIYIGNSDWPINNIALWRTRYRDDTAFGDCRWRWILYDVEQGMHLEWVKANTMKDAANRDPVFAGLLKNESFSRALRERLLELSADTFSPERVGAFISDYKQRMAAAIEKKYQRFSHATMTLDDFYEGCDNIDQFFRERPEIIMKRYGGTD